MESKKEYTNGEVTVVWKPGLCIHSEKCVRGLPAVFKPREKPWIQVEGANSEAMMEAIDRCPSGALSYYKNGENPPTEEPEASIGTRVEVLKNGPLMVHGPLEIIHSDGNTEVKSRNTAFCRCGKTGNAPFCDGSHNQN